MSTNRRAPLCASVAAPGSSDDPRRLGDGEPDKPGAERHHEVLAQRPLAVCHGLVDHVGHSGVALDTGSQIRVAGVADPLDVGHEVGEDDLLDTCLAE